MSFTNYKEIAKSKNQLIKFIHVATGTVVEIPAFLKEYSDDYSVSWGSEQIFDRSDPIKPYQSTTRTINLGFDVLSHSLDNAVENLNNFSTLTKMLYPVYSDPLSEVLSGPGAMGRTIKAPPLIRLKFVNLIQSAAGTGELLGCIEGIGMRPNLDAGLYVSETGDLYPKVFDLDFRFTPQHESPLGWDSSTRSFITDSFPYAASSAAKQTKRATTVVGVLE